MDSATRLIALQGERDYVLFRMADLDADCDRLHPTSEKRSLMILYERLQEKISELVDEVLDVELGYVVHGPKIKEIIECNYTDGLFREKHTGEVVQCSDRQDGRAVVIFLKDEKNVEEKDES